MAAVAVAFRDPQVRLDETDKWASLVRVAHRECREETALLDRVVVKVWLVETGHKVLAVHRVRRDGTDGTEDVDRQVRPETMVRLAVTDV